MAEVAGVRTTGVKTLTSTTIDTVTLTGRTNIIYIWNRSGSTDLTCTVTTDGEAPTDPASGSAETWTVGPGQELPINVALILPTVANPTVGTTKVKILGNANTYAVRCE